MVNTVIILITTTLFLNVSSAYKILLVFPWPNRSHSILGDGYVRHLLDAGHEVTYITPIPIKGHHPNLRQVDVSSNFQVYPSDELLHLTKLLKKEVKLDVSRILDFTYDVTRATILHEAVQNLLHEPKEEYDVVIAEWLYSELYSGFSSVFNCPLIWFCSTEPMSMVLSLIDEDPNPVYFPDQLNNKILPLNFWDRVKELWSLLRTNYHQWLRSGKVIDAYERAFQLAVTRRGGVLPPFNEIKYNASLMFGNSHFSTGQAIRLPINYVPILGYHIQEDISPLSEDLKRIMDNDLHGVIYFSMGSNLKSKEFPDDIKKGLLRMFGELKHTVLWKLEEIPPDVPENVHILQWPPQQAVLAHPNCVLFITHGGGLSTTETLHFGVPIIGIPIFADQFTNVAMAANKGYAKKVDYTYGIIDELKNAIDEVLNNSTYCMKAKELSAIYHDRLIPPSKELVYWVEYVVRTLGAKHLRSPALAVPLYQKLYLDLIIVIIFIIIILKITLQLLRNSYNNYSFNISKIKELQYYKNKLT